MPKPYSCYSVIWPLDFSIVTTHEDTTHFLVKGVSSEALVRLDDFSILKSVNPGDEWIGYNNKTIPHLIAETKLKSGGSNPDSMHRALLSFFTIRTGYLFILPTETTATYTLKRPDGSIYTISVPLCK